MIIRPVYKIRSSKPMESGNSPRIRIRYCRLWKRYFFSELCWGKAMMAYTKLQKRKEEEK